MSVISIIVFLFVLMVGYIEISWKNFKKQSKFYRLPSDIQLINLGSTYAFYGLQYKNRKVKAVNMALIPQYLYYDNILLRRYARKMKKGAHVLMILPNFVFCVEGEKIGYKNDEYYLFLKPWEIVGFKIKKYIGIRWQAIREPIFHEKKKVKEKWAGYVTTYEEKTEHAKKRIADWEKNIGIKNDSNFKVTKELQDRIEKNILLVIEMIDFCEKENLTPTLVLMPSSSIMKDLLQENVLKSCLFKPVEKILNTKKVVILDYSNTSEFLNEELYLNSDCLNEKGRILFTEKVLKDLKLEIG